MLNIDEVKEYVKEYNKSKELVLCDNLVHRAFSIEESEKGIWTRVVVLNALWGCNLSAEQTENVASKLCNEWGEIQNIIMNLQNMSLSQENQERVCDSAGKLLKIIFGDGHKILVFASKFCHWIAPQVFPIIDRRNVRPAIYQDQIEENIVINEQIAENPNFANIDDCIADYKKLINFYARELQNLGQENINDLIQYDYRTQPPNYQHTNTILRVLDKYFWEKGGGGESPWRVRPTGEGTK